MPIEWHTFKLNYSWKKGQMLTTSFIPYSLHILFYLFDHPVLILDHLILDRTVLTEQWRTVALLDFTAFWHLWTMLWQITCGISLILIPFLSNVRFVISILISTLTFRLANNNIVCDRVFSITVLIFNFYIIALFCTEEDPVRSKRLRFLLLCIFLYLLKGY